MLMRRRAFARSAPSFGRREMPLVADQSPSPSSTLASDLRLFALTYACGFLFVSTYLA